MNAVMRPEAFSPASAALAVPADGITPALAAILAKHDSIADQYRADYAAAVIDAGSEYVPDEVLDEITDSLDEAFPAFSAILAFVPVTLADVQAKASAVLTSPCAPTELGELTAEEIGSFLRSLAGEVMVREHG